MDLFEGITQELRGSSERTGRADRSRSADPRPRSGEPTDDADESVLTRRGRDDEHVCQFCQTEFDANRGACPDCGAELVLRGER